MSRSRRWLLPALAALFGAIGCSSDGEVLLATIRRDADAPEITTCTPSGYNATDVGLDLYFVIDHSSLLDTVEWNLLVFFGLGGLFATPEFEGMGVGFAIYPTIKAAPQNCIDACGTVPTCGCLDRCGCEERLPDQQGACRCQDWGTSCNDAAYAPTFEIGRLGDGKHQRALAAIPPPVGFPAMNPALYGSLRYRNAWESSHLGRHITQVLVAAWPFSWCSSTMSISDSEKVLSGADKPKTYVVAVNLAHSDYDRLAVAGRTDAATRIRINTTPPSPPLTTTFVDLVRKISATDGRCEYLLPPPSPELDYGRINLTAPSGGTLYPRVLKFDDCDRTPQGWYYDPPLPQQPTRIIACEGACQSLHGPTGQAAANAFIQLGCPTVLDARL